LKIVLVTELTGPDDEGMRVWATNCEHALGGAGHTVARLQLAGPPAYAAGDPRNLAALRALKPDVILYVPYSGLTKPAMVRLRALGLAAPRAQRCIAVLQAGQEHLRPPRALVADVGLFASRRVRQHAGAIARRTAVVYPLVDRTRFRPAPVDRRRVRSELGIAGDKPMVLHVGHLKASRNLDVLGRLAGTGRWSVVMVASTSTEEDVAVRPDLERRGVTVVRRYLPDIERFYRAADVYVFPVRDPLGSIEVPLSVVEARSCGTPVVAARFGALPELFAESELMRYSDDATFTETVARALEGRRRDADPGDVQLAVFDREHFVQSVERALVGGRRGAGTVVLSGLDGAGKSTQVQLLVDELRGRGLCVETLWCRWDPLVVKPAIRLLGTLSRRRGGALYTNGAASAAGAGAPGRSSVAERRRSIRARLLASPVFAMVWRALMVIDYGVRLSPRVRRARRRTDVLLLDRYWHDVLVDYSFGRELADPPRLLTRLLPEPDGVVILDVDEDAALQRKKDTPDRTYLTERRRLYRAVADRCGARVVDATRPAPAVFADVAAHIEDIVASTRAERGPRGRCRKTA
jgi:thymidylate kinase/glycosyltransferase involved in cell wall biosynthesis